MQKTMILTLFVALMILPASAAADTRALDGGEIFVTTEDVAGSDVPRIEVRGVINAAPSAVWDIVSDCNGYVGRMPRITEAREVRRSGSTVICDVTVGLPFPMSDLQAVTRATHTVGPPEWRREWTMIEGTYRINDGSWVLTTFNGDSQRTLAVYTVHAEPNSRVPNSVRRRAQTSSMPGIIERLRELTE